MTPESIIAHIASRGNEYIEPSVNLCKFWFRVWNAIEFDNKLSTPRFIVTDNPEEEVCGEFSAEDYVGLIRINAPFTRQRHMFIATMLHEMLHQKQWEDGEEPGHDDKFLTLAACYSLKYGVDV